eukprot:1201677-Heterocapsa_arctica.AAC.1
MPSRTTKTVGTMWGHSTSGGSPAEEYANAGDISGSVCLEQAPGGAEIGSNLLSARLLATAVAELLLLPRR